MGGKKRLSAALSAGLLNRSSATDETPEKVVKNVRKQLEALNTEIEGLRDSIETAKREIEQVEENKNNAEEEKEQAKKGVASANDAIEEAKDEIKQAKDEIKQVKDEIKQVKDDLTKAERSRERIRLQNLILGKEKIISDDKKIISDDKKVILSKEKIIRDNNKIIRDNNKIILSKEKIISDDKKIISDDKQALLAKEEKRDELEKLITLDSVWDALAIQLPPSSHVGNFNSTKTTKYGKTSTIKHKYHPSGVWELPTDQLRKVLKSYRKHAMDDKVPRVNLRVPVMVLFPKSMVELSGEGSVSKNCERVLEIVLDVFNDSENLLSSMLVKPPGDLANHDPGEMSGWVGQPDQSISFKTPKGEYRGILCVEIKTPLYQTRENESLAANWCNDADCNDACGSENHPSPPEKDAEKQHETWKSPIRQIYSYMCANQKRVAVVSTYEQWWFVVRDCTQQVFVSRAFKPDSQYSRDGPRGESLLQMLFLWIQFAMDTDDNQSNRLKKIERWKECPVGSSSSSSSCSSTSLGSRCQHSVIQQTYIPPCVKGGPNGFERRVVSVGCFEKVKTLGTWKTGATWITEFDGQRGVVKCADCLKNPEAEEHVVQETKIYEHLKSLQGGAIPRLLYGDYTLEDFLYAVCTSYAGKSLGEFKGRITQELAKNVRECIKKVNDAGVWHNDIAARNFVVDENLGVKLIDFGESRVEPSAFVDESRSVERMLAELSTPSN